MSILPSQTLKPRLFFADNLRTFLIALVFLVHFAIIYGSPVGSFYGFREHADLPSDLFYILFTAAAQAFFMGLQDPNNS